ncbi:hypothetical protein COCVIDRAFT_37550 [Bipolaris victoriae FI3]|uniref:Uncharacterized protein n=1 Tax=Bipolaris victoriae (strain FI3) TaxID=930091 RepID=W7EMS3_BIPV3|nr:hypothetical protein COCVIDRAFT_37550 [Bipolaris victoriae FI3]
MVHSLVRKEGVPALAYRGCHKSMTWFCSLKIVHVGEELAVSLEHSMPSHGVDHKQVFILRYEGDNLVPGKNSLGAIGLSVPASLMSTMQRHGNPNFQTLSLTLKKPCSIWYPKESTSLHDDFPKLLTLARTKEVRIFFDTNWLADRNFQTLQCIVTGSRQLAKISRTAQFSSLYQELDWLPLRFIQDANHGTDTATENPASGVIPSIEAEAPPFQDVVHDNPPPYTQPSGKRPRHSSTSLTPDDYNPKRAREHSRSSLDMDGASPTPSLRAKSTVSSSATVSVDLFQDAVTSAVQQMLSSTLNKTLSEVLQKELPSAIRRELPHVLEKIIQKTIADSPSRCSSPIPPCTQILNEPTHHVSTPNSHFTLGKMIKGAVTTAVREALDEARDQSSELYTSASIELEEYSTELKGDLAATTEDHMVNCNENLDEMVAKAEQRLSDYLTDFEAHADELVIKTEDRLYSISKKSYCSPEVHIVPKPGQRAASLPILKDAKTVANRT